MEFVSPDGAARYAALTAVASEALVALDFDGTLAPIVEDPEQARIHPEAGEVLVELAAHVRAIAVVTGRPARQVLDLGGLESVGDALAEHGTELHVFGQYGNERWSTEHRRIRSPRPPAGLSSFERGLPRLLREHDAAEAWVEEKGLAVAVHTRRMPDPEGAYQRLLPALREQAAAHDLILEPGRQVIEVRAPGMDKGIAVDTLVDRVGARGILFAGDDLGDIDAFESVAAWSATGLATLLVCSASDEQNALIGLSDIVVPGPDGVLALLRKLIADAA
ncbi:trehalose-phosphatase [Nocardioides insulae]|uniref:trehalose-phosphatase n=1 Tax=Nocardioides insulae TaxID=394734 RepID=UPI00040A398E|nr:trehalose-phosphatase [Nocardioides insulae]